MSREDVEIVRRVYEAATHGDAATVLALYDPEVEWDTRGHPAGSITGHIGIYHGHEGVRNWFRSWDEEFEDLRYEIEELIDAGDQVISVSTWRGRGRASGVEVEWKHHAGIWTIHDGKIVRVVWFRTRVEALEAAGLSE
jgi:hypothetical protein